MKIIIGYNNKLGTSAKFMVDDEDYDWLMEYPWYIGKDIKYAQTMWQEDGKFRGSTMHKLIWEHHYGPIRGRKEMDHVDRNKKNNQKSNLRVATREQNLANRPPTGGTSRYKGVTVSRLNRINNFRASMAHNRTLIDLGYFGAEKTAAKAVDQCSLYLNGDFAYLNFPELKEQYLEEIKNRKWRCNNKNTLKKFNRRKKK